MRKQLAASAVCSLVLAFGFAFPAEAAGLTSAQVSAIISLLQSFGASASVVTNVEAALTGSPASSAAASGPICLALNYNLSFGATDAATGGQVSQLQNFLISQGYLASGSATGYFGPATESAIEQFQSKNGVVSAGSPDTTGYGAVGPATRNALAAFCKPITPPAPISTSTPPTATSAPSISSISPSSATTGQSVTIYGSNLSGATEVDLAYQGSGGGSSSVPAQNLTVTSTSVTFAVPQALVGIVGAGVYQVSVKTASGTSNLLPLIVTASPEFTATINSAYGNQSIANGTNSALIGSFTLSAGATSAIQVNSIALSMPASEIGMVRTLSLANAVDPAATIGVVAPSTPNITFSVNLRIAPSSSVTINIYGSYFGGTNGQQLQLTLGTGTQGADAAGVIVRPAAAVPLQVITVAGATTSTATLSASPTSGTAPLNVVFTTNALPQGTYNIKYSDGLDASAIPECTSAASTCVYTQQRTFQNPGMYTATLYNGGVDSTGNVTGTALATATFSVTSANAGVTLKASPASGSAPLTVTFTIGGSVSSYQINYGDGTLGGGGVSDATCATASCTIKHTYASPGGYTATLTAGGQTATTVIAVNPKLSCTLTAPASVYVNGDYTASWTLTGAWGTANTNAGPAVSIVSSLGGFLYPDSGFSLTSWDPVSNRTDTVAIGYGFPTGFTPVCSKNVSIVSDGANGNGTITSPQQGGGAPIIVPNAPLTISGTAKSATNVTVVLVPASYTGSRSYSSVSPMLKGNGSAVANSAAAGSGSWSAAFPNGLPAGDYTILVYNTANQNLLVSGYVVATLKG